MTNQVVNIIKRASIGKPKKYDILTFPTHERYETQLAKTGHNFYVFNGEGMKEWNTSYAPVPDNYYMMPKNAIYQGIHYDFILSQSKFSQFQLAHQINDQRLNVPVVSLEHTVPIPMWPQGQKETLASMVGDFNVFISEHSQEKWGGLNMPNSRVVHHGVDTETFKPRKTDRGSYCLSVVNDFVNRDYCCNYSGWTRITQGIETKLVGETEGLSKAASSVDDLVGEYNACGLFLNTSTLSPVPTTLLEAMSCGCAVVSTATCMIPEVITHGENDLISNDENELRSYVEALLNDDKLRDKLGKAARETVVARFSQDKFVDNWNTLFDEVVK